MGFEPTTDSLGGHESRFDYDGFKLFLESLGLAPRTVKEHLKNCRRVEGILCKPVGGLTELDVRRLIAYVEGKYSTSYVNNIKKTLLRVFRDYLKAPWVVAGVKVKHVDGGFKLARLPSNEELRAFYEALPGFWSKVFFMVAKSSGLRKSEVLSLTASDVDLEGRLVSPRGHRGSTKRCNFSFIDHEAAVLVEEALRRRKPSDARLIQIHERSLRRAFRIARLKTGINVTPQTLREWFAVQARKAGMDRAFVNFLQGRLRADVLDQHYTRYWVEELKRQYERVEPSLKLLHQTEEAVRWNSTAASAA